jgi:hypothetical protein
VRLSACDPNVWSGRALQEVFVDLADVVLHQCIRSLIGACAPDHHGYQRACDLISGEASNGLFGSPVFARAGKTDPPSSSHSLAERGGLRVLIMSSIASWLCGSFVRAWRPFLRPDLRVQSCAARWGRQGWPSRLPCLSLALPGHTLTGLSTARGLSGSARCFIGLRTRRRAPCEEPPRRCGRACWRAQSPARCGGGASLRPRSTI